MKVFTITLLILCCSLFAFAQTHSTPKPFKNDLTREKLKGKIRSVTEKEFNSRGDSQTLKSVTRFDDNGNIAEFFTYSPTGTMLSRTTFKYNDSGKLIEELRYKADGTMNVKTTCKYDEKGNKIEEYNYDAGGILFMKVAQKFDGKGNRIVKDSYNEFGSLFLKCNYKFDEDGNEISVKDYDSHKGLKFSTTFEYDGSDKFGNWLKRITYKNDEPFSVTEREFEYH